MSPVYRASDSWKRWLPQHRLRRLWSLALHLLLRCDGLLLPGLSSFYRFLFYPFVSSVFSSVLCIHSPLDSFEFRSSSGLSFPCL
ncbi:BnaCnng31310D [Brassica napus]|uniref:BnaCnng31310D protein n=1 Tax=Brassica napus TaxID=3708 RepID=A0A078J3K0_BRANA|nr:BnaCnng31310D [Brassica napus]